MSNFGQAKDGKIFTAESPEVLEYMNKYPDVTLEAAIGSVVGVYERSLESQESSEETVE